MRLLVDTPSLLWQSLLAGESKEFGCKVEFEGKSVWVNGWEHGYDCAMSHLVSVFNELNIGPAQTIFVKAGKHSKARRKAIYNGYKEGRDSRPPEAYVEFEKCFEELRNTFMSAGSHLVVGEGTEEDDILAFLAKKLDGEIVVLTRDGDMTTLISDRVALYQNGKLTRENKYGPFPHRFVPVYKALCGDGNEYKGASGFGPKSFLDFLVWAGDPGLAALEGMMIRRTLHELQDDVAEFKPLSKVITSAEHVYQSYECALLHDEWVDTERNPLKYEAGVVGEVKDERLAKWVEVKPEPDTWWETIHPVKPDVVKNHAVFDVELIGKLAPVFLVCVKVIETGERASFWWHVEGDMGALRTMLQREDLTWVSFNGLHFDAPLISAALCGKDPRTLKDLANAIIVGNGKAWQMPSQFDYDPFEFDHIDLYEVAPGVQISLKTYAGRMAYKTMVDLPFDHDKDLTEDECVVLESYCQNDLGVTEALFNAIRTEVNLRVEMSREHGIDLRSKSDAQVAEAVLKKVAGIKGKSINQPAFVTYKVPDFIQTDSDVINDIIQKVENTRFMIHPANGQVESPDFLADPIELGFGSYQMGVGGLHSTHDKQLHLEASDDFLISDFDVASYYPNVMLKAGLTPRLEGGAGERFIAAYRDIYDKRIEAKRSGNKKVANALKISLNGTFGKLGSPYSSFYSPDLMLAVTMTGQLNLMCLIYDLEFRPDITVISANTDGIMVRYPASLRDKVLRVITENAVRTGFEYEETAYRTVAIKDVNNYVAITADRAPVVISPDGTITECKASGGKAKRKGLYASNRPEENPLYLMKNPSMEICSTLAVDYLKSGIHPRDNIRNYTNVADYVAIRAVKGGGIQYDDVVEVDDWVCVNDMGTKDNKWMRQAWLDSMEQRAPVKRKSRPAPVKVGVGGVPFGRIARWYMKAGSTTPINYSGSGNKVPKTEGAKVCMTLPDALPDDIDLDWYVNEAVSILGDLGVDTSKLTA